MAQRIVRDQEADGRGSSEIPIICKSCLGDSPYVRMTRADFDKECKICTRPFTPFRWQHGPDASFKNTEICQTCSNLKNICQVCLLNPVPVQARPGLVYGSSIGKMPSNDAILHLQRTIQDNKGKWPLVCSFYIMGECTRGESCPYRHVEMPETDGENDPGKAGEMEPPEDESIKTLYVGGLNSRVLWQDLEGQLLSFEELDSFSIYGKKACITFKTREAAEKVMQEPSNRLVVNGQRLKLTWAGPQVPKPDLVASKQLQQSCVVAHSGLLPQAVISLQQNQHPPMHLPPPNQYQPFYFSMDPQRMGAAISTQELGGSRTFENDGASSSSSSSS